MSETLKQFEVLQWASSFLENYNRETKVAEILLQHHLNVSRSEFFMNMRETVPGELIVAYKKDIREHALTGIPVQHLTGYEYFYGRKFTVNKHVLIPRPETEELMQQVIQTFQNKPVTIVDLGTGSGVIAITLALELPRADVYATDISTKALKIAKENAQHLAAPVTFYQGDFLQPLLEKKIMPDIIVSNPPYISREDEVTLADTVKNFDPELALFANNNGLQAYKTILEQAANISSLQKLFFEIGFKQAEDVTALIKSVYPLATVLIKQDINKKDRIVVANIKSNSKT